MRGGGRPLRVPVRAEGVLPRARVEQQALAFPPTFVGAAARLPLTLVNDAPVPATLVCDFAARPEFELLLAREAWAGAAGYDACPVQRIGANGEASALGSKRGSRRASLADGRRGGGVGARSMAGGGGGGAGGSGGGGGGGGLRFVIRLKPSSSLAMSISYRPSRPGSSQFALPMALVTSSGAPPAAAAIADGAAAPPPSDPLAVPVSAEGAQPRVLLSKSAVDFGACVVRRSGGGGGGRAAPYETEVYARNATDRPLAVRFGAPTTDAEPGCLGVFAVEPRGPLLLAPDEGAAVVLRFDPRDARTYEASVAVDVADADADADATGADTVNAAGFGTAGRSGSRAASAAAAASPRLVLAAAGTGVFPRLAFDAAEVVLPPVPLGVRSSARFHVFSDGYDNLELVVRCVCCVWCDVCGDEPDIMIRGGGGTHETLYGCLESPPP